MSEGQLKKCKIENEYCPYTHAVFNNASLINRDVGQYLDDDPYSYFALARVTKRMWEFYCENDKAVKHMRYVWNLRVDRFIRVVYAQHSAIHVCIRWAFAQRRKITTMDKLVESFAVVGAEAGDLRIIKMATEWVKDKQTQDRLLVAIVAMFGIGGRDEEAVYFVQHLPWPRSNAWEDERIRKAAYAQACRNVVFVPKFYQYLCSLGLHESTYKSDSAGRAELLCDVAAGDLQHVEKNFAFFWNQWLPTMDEKERMRLIWNFLRLVMPPPNTSVTQTAKVALPLLAKRFFGSNEFTFETGDLFKLTVELDTFDNFADERIVHITFWFMGIRYAAMGKVPALYC